MEGKLRCMAGHSLLRGGFFTRRGSRRAGALLSILFALFLLSALAHFMLRQEGRAQDDVVERYRTRGETSARLISAYINDLGGRQARFASTRLADRDPSHPVFNSMVESLGFEAAVLLSSDGRLIHVYPDRPEIVGQNLSAQYEHLARALAGRPAVSNVVPSAARGVPILAVAVPYETPEGRRVISGAFEVASSPLRDFLQNVLPFKSANVHLIDRSGVLAASAGAIPDVPTSLGKLDPALDRSLRSGGDSYLSDGRRFRVTFAEIPNTPLRLVMGVPESELFEAVGKLQWVPWLIYLGLVTASAVAATVLIRLLQREEELRTERRKLKEQLDEQLRLNKALDEFAGRVAHDLRNPLGNALMAAEMASKQREDARTLEKWLDMAQRQARRGIELIQGLLDLAKASGTPNRERVDLNALVTEIAEDIQGIDVVTRDLPTIHADKLAIRQALANLLDNAGRYGRSNGTARVAVSAEQEKTAVTITVEDEGPGLDPEEAAGIFGAFERGKSESLPGTGLGLAIVETAARAHGGRAWYEPRPGGGSAFKLSIPEKSRSVLGRESVNSN